MTIKELSALNRDKTPLALTGSGVILYKEVILLFEPNGECYLLSNAKVDPNHQDILYPSDASTLASTMQAHSKYHVQNARPFNVTGFTGFILLEGSPENYFDCNYLMFKNTSYGNKWFYAFLGTPQARNSGAVMIPYEVDLFATWIYDCELPSQFVVRQHVTDDSRGKWLAKENVELGEFVCVDSGSLTATGDTDVNKTPCLLIAYTFASLEPYSVTSTQTGGLSWNVEFPDLTPVFAGGQVVDGIYQGTRFIAFECDTDEKVTTINNWITALQGKGQIDMIQGMWCVPRWVVTEWVGTENVVNRFDANALLTRVFPSPTTISGYTPKNNKLFNEQSNYIVVTNGLGGATEYGYEYFDTKTSASFQIYAQVGSNTTLRMVPRNYKGADIALMYAMDLAGYPQASFSYNGYANENNLHAKEYKLAEKSANGALSTIGYDYMAQTAKSAIGSGGGSVQSLAEGNIAGAVTGFANMMGDLWRAERGVTSYVADNSAIRAIAQRNDAVRIPDSVTGSASGGIAYAMGDLEFKYWKMQPSAEFARRYDHFLSEYGYEIDDYQPVNLTGRANWNFIQLAGATILGNAPMQAKQYIASLFNRGVRLWHNETNFMNLNADNPIV